MKLIKKLFCGFKGHPLTESSEGWWSLEGCVFIPFFLKQKTCVCGKHRMLDKDDLNYVEIRKSIDSGKKNV